MLYYLWSLKGAEPSFMNTLHVQEHSCLSLPSHPCRGQSDGLGYGSMSDPEWEVSSSGHQERLFGSRWPSRGQVPTSNCCPQTSLSPRLGDEDPAEATITGSVPHCPQEWSYNNNNNYEQNLCLQRLLWFVFSTFVTSLYNRNSLFIKKFNSLYF